MARRRALLQKRGWGAHLGTQGEVFCGPAPRQVADDERRRIRACALPGAREEPHTRWYAGPEVYLLAAHERKAGLADSMLRSGIVSGMAETEDALGRERPRRGLAVVEDITMQLKPRRGFLRVLRLDALAHGDIRW